MRLTTLKPALLLVPCLLVGRATAAPPSSAQPPAAGAAPAAEEKLYTVSTSLDPNALKVGDTAKLTLKILPKAPWQLKTTTPFEALLSGSAGVDVGRVKLGSKDFELKEHDRTLVSPFVVKAGGAQSIKAALTFFLCTEQICQRYKDTVPVAGP